MAEARYTTTTRLAPGEVWDFVQDMDRWAPFVMGYQSHERRTDTESVWMLKGDLGVMSRTLRFSVLITEWNGPERVRFTMRGLNEPMSGEGAFTIEAGGGADREAPRARPRAGLLARWLRSLSRWLFARLFGRVEREAPPAIASGEAASRLTFELRIDPGGPMAPMVNAMIQPLMRPAAEQLADRILAHLEGRAEGAPR